MSETQTAGRQPGGWTETRGGVFGRSNYTTSAGNSQPNWQTSKAEADRTWTATRALLVALGFSDPQPTRRDLDLQGVDVICSDGRRLAWRCRSRRYLSFQDCTFRRSRPNGTPTECAKWGSADFALWTWTSSGGVLTDWLLLRCDRVTPLLAKPWPTLNMPDATAACIPWRALAQAGAIVTASRGVRAAL